MTAKHKLVTLLLLLFCSTGLFAQDKVSEADVKKYDKALELFKKQEYEEADKILVKLTEKYPWQGTIWDLLSKSRFYQYAYAREEGMQGNFTITVKDKDGKEKSAEDDTLVQQLAKMLNGISPKEVKKKLVINTCREATLKAYRALYSSIILRNLLIDVPKDTAIAPAAKEQFDNAEAEFQKGNYNSAIIYYKKAIEFDPSYYKARLYLGDSYYALKDYARAVKYFKEATERFPDELEPRKYAVDALFYLGNYEEAYKQAKEAIAVYPDVSMFDKIEDAAAKLGKSFDRGWIERSIYPNVIGKKREDETKDKAWLSYAGAQAKIEPFCDKDGLITKKNTLTNARYAEVYAWEELLANAPSTSFEMARKMQSQGYLDCYVFISLYHIDLQSQYKDFAANNRQRILDYLDLLATN